MGVLSIDHVNHYPALLEARRDGSADVSKVLASCDPRTPSALSVQLATLWTTVTLSLPELERLLRVPSRQVILAGDPGRGAIYLPTDQAEFMARSQIPPAARVNTTLITNPAWRVKPSWYMVAKQDRAINPDLERMYAARAHSHTVEVDGAHTIYISRAKEVAAMIEEAAQSAGN